MSTHPPQAKEALNWLLEPQDPGVRYLAIRDLVGLPNDHPEMVSARGAAYTQGPIAVILEQMNEAGYWSEPGPGYNQKYFSTVWSMIMLAQLGAAATEDPRVQKACAYVLDHALTARGQFSTTSTGSGTADCLQGNLCWALTALGCEDPRLETAFDWMARSVTGEGIAPMHESKAEIRYYAGKCGPLFACGANNKLSCAWGGIKVMLALSQRPEQRRTPAIRQAIEMGAEFLLAGDPARAGYPNGWSEKPSQNWWKFGFPVFYVTDMLQNVEALLALGYATDARLAPALELISEKQDAHGRWQMEYNYAGKTWVDFGQKKLPNKWVTLRAMKVLQMANNDQPAKTPGR